jgi:predicted small lipoprotein YifL
VRRAASTALLAACTAVALTACGQKGPLTLPDKSATVVTTAPAPAATPATAPAGTPTDKSKEKSGNSPPPQ